MMKITKRILSAILVVCMMLSVMVPAVSADGNDKTYSIPESYDNGNSSSSKKNRLYDEVVDFPDYGWEYVNRGDTTDTAYKYAQISNSILSMSGANAGQWFAIRIKGIDTTVGYNTLKVTVYGHSLGGKYNFYLLPGNTGNTDEEIEAALSTPIAVVENIDGTVNGKAAFENLELTETNYVLVFLCKELINDNGYIGLTEITLSGDSSVATAEAKIGDTPYTTVEAAIGAAGSGDEIDLQADCDADTINIPEGVTLDLNGFTLEANYVRGKNGNIVDSSAKDTGVLISENVELSQSNSELPLVSAANSYRFFTATLTKLSTTKQDGDAVKHYFRLLFDNADAYGLIASGNSGLIIGADLTWDGSESKYAKADPTQCAEFYSGWANAANGNTNIAISLKVKGTEKVENFMLTPNVQANGVTLAIAE